MIYEYAIYVGQLDLESGGFDNLQGLSDKHCAWVKQIGRRRAVY